MTDRVTFQMSPQTRYVTTGLIKWIRGLFQSVVSLSRFEIHPCATVEMLL